VVETNGGGMKLLQVSKAYAPHLGGIETVVRQLAEGMIERGIESSVLVAHQGRTAVETISGVSVTRIGSPAAVASLPLALGFPAALARSSADVLMVHEPSLLAAASMFARPSIAEQFGARIVWWHSDIHRQRVLAPVYGPVFRRLLDRADRIIVATPHHVSSSATLQPYTEKVDIVPYGVRLSDFVVDPERAARVRGLRSGTPDDALRIVAVGRLVPYKGHRLLLDAVRGLPGVVVTIVGSGPLLADLQAHESVRRGQARIVPSLTREAMIDQLHASDIFAFPSIHVTEAFGISQVEAMACGKPVVCFDLPTGVSWVNRHEESGLLCPTGDVDALRDALRRLGSDPGERARLATGALERATAVFDERVMLDRVAEIVTGVVRSAAPGEVPA
jgi:glycosyltransferase involved in cell wall biosynthesis